MDEQINFLQGNMQYLFEKYVPMRTNDIRNGKPWFSNEIKISINQRNYAYRWERYRTTEFYEIFRACRRNTNLKIITAK